MELVAATEEDKRARDRLTYEAWGERLEPAQYLEREARLRGHPWARAAMTTWLLRDDGGAVLASCESYRMPSLLDGAPGETWAVASVFTEPARRGRGHATEMMTRLLARARAAGAQASTLFSDVGAPLYEAGGWRARPAEDLVFPPAPGNVASGVDKLLVAAPELSAPDEPFVVWPSAMQLDWHLERTRTYGALLGRPPLEAVGARAGGGAAAWAVEWNKDQLLVLALAARRPHEAEALVRAARRVAWALRLREVRLWSQPWPFGGRGDLGGDRVARIGSLPMVAPLAPSLRADQWTQIPRGVWV
jgi:GNAT superfamily N-acetyltransferase